MANIIIITGHPRSGTTARGLALAALPDHYYFGEILHHGHSLALWTDAARNAPPNHTWICKIFGEHFKTEFEIPTRVSWIIQASRPKMERQKSAHSAHQRGSWYFNFNYLVPNPGTPTCDEETNQQFLDAVLATLSVSQSTLLP